MKKSLIIFFVLFSAVNVLGQRRTIEKADDFYNRNYFNEAIVQYEKAEANRDIGAQKAYVTRRLAESHLHLFNYYEANKWYEKLFKIRTRLTEDDYYNYATTLRAVKRYEEARERFFQYANLVGDEKIKEYYSNLSDWTDTINKVAQIELFNTNVNVGQWSFGVSHYSKGLIFSKPKDAFVDSKTPFYDLVYADVEKEKFGGIKLLPGFQNSELFNGGSFFSVADSTLYFTSNASDRKKFRSIGSDLGEDGTNNLQLFASKVYKGRFKEKFPLSLNSKDFSNAHPTLNKSGDTLFFVSNRPGGKGGFDIYRSVKNNGKWQKPENIESLNTDKNEMFPFLKGNKLYFSSYGHFNYGGSDLFEALVNSDGSISTPENLGKPYNSSMDDFALVLNESNEDGYFSSNRNNMKGSDRIYYFEKNEPDVINAIARRRFNLEGLDSVKVEVRQVIGDNETGIISSAFTDTTGTTQLTLEKGKEFNVYFISSGFKQDTIVKEVSNDDRRDIIALFDKEPKKGESIEIKNIYFEYEKWDILEESKPVLDQLYYYMRQYEDINVFIGAHTDCRGTELYNFKLSDKRAQSTIQYLILKGVHPDRLTWKGYGKSQIKVICGLCSKCTEEQHKENRRVTFEIQIPGEENISSDNNTELNNSEESLENSSEEFKNEEF